MSQTQVSSLASAATEAAAAGRWQDAERLWMRVRTLAPDHAQALFSLGVHAYRRGDSVGALELLRAARVGAPQDPTIPLTISVVHRDRNEPEMEWGALVESLSIDPYFLPGLLGKGEFLLRSRRTKAAAAIFRDVLKVAPVESRWPSALRKRLENAREIVGQDAEEMASFLFDRIAASRDTLDSRLTGRWDEAVAVLTGRSRPYHSDCNQLYVPRLPALPFYDDNLFPWIPALEARVDEIKAELEELVTDRLEGFTPYVAYLPGDPVNQWKELNHSRSWSSYHLWSHGKPVDQNLARCPATAEALALVDAVEIAGLCPNAMFSALAPHTAIPPHTGETNARLVAHLPLVIPANCSFRVGAESRQWEEGKVLVFDDTLEHEARNGSDMLRVVLIFDVWNPLLSMAERDMVTALAEAARDYRALID